MPSLSVPFQFGSTNEGAPGATQGGGAYFMRRKRWMAFVCILLVFML